MLGLASISDRIRTLEQTLHRAPLASPNHLQSLTLPDTTVPPVPAPGTSATNAAAPAASAKDGTAAASSTVISKLTELSTAFQHILSLDPSVQQYMSRASAIESLLESEGGSGSTGAPIPPAASLVTRELEVVLSASEQFEHSAALLQQLQALLPVLDQKWPLEDFAALNQRVEHVHSLLPRQAFAAAQSHVQLERYLAAYNVLLDFLSRQFLLWNQQLNTLEEQLNAQLAQKSLRAR